MLKRNKLLVVFLVITILCASIGFALVADTLVVNGRLALNLDNGVDEEEEDFDDLIHFTSITSVKKVNINGETINDITYTPGTNSNSPYLNWYISSNNTSESTSENTDRIAWLVAENAATAAPDEALDYDTMQLAIPAEVFKDADSGDKLIINAEIEYKTESTGNTEEETVADDAPTTVNLTLNLSDAPQLSSYVSINASLSETTLSSGDKATLTIVIELKDVPEDINTVGEFIISIDATTADTTTTPTA